MPEATPFQVMIVDDHPLMRRGVRQLLELDPGFEVVAEAGDGASAIDLANRLDIDVILLDLNMKGMSGLDTLNALRRDGVTAQIIILTVSDASSDVFALIDAGADGYLLKDSDPEVLLEAIRAGAKGSKVFSERVNQYLREREMFGAEEDPFSVLTERELDVLHELAQGLSNKQIASVLNISEQTVKVHIRNLLRKLNVRSRVAATILFLQHRGAQKKQPDGITIGPLFIYSPAATNVASPARYYVQSPHGEYRWQVRVSTSSPTRQRLRQIAAAQRR